MTLLVAVLVCLLVSLLLSGIGAWAVRRILGRRVPAPKALPPITVLKPLKGVEVGLYENLVSIASQDYPDFEVLFGIEDPDDPAFEVVQRLKREYPNVQLRIVTGAPVLGMNPKVNNLLQMVRFARHDTVLISDSNVRAASGYLRAMARELADPSVGLVHSPLVGLGGDTVGSRLENLQLDTVTAYGVCGMQFLTGKPLVIGKSMLLRRSDLDRLGGLQSVADVLAEDYAIGQRFHAAGFAVRLSPHRIQVVTAGWSLDRFVNRQVRWCQMRRWILPLGYLFEPTLNTLLWALALIPAVLRAPLSTTARSVVLTLVPTSVAIRLWLDSAQVAFLRGRGLALRELAWLPCKDLLTPALWLAGWLKRTVNWRGTFLRIGPGSALRRVQKTPVAEQTMESLG